jgi:hypothetical protein
MREAIIQYAMHVHLPASQQNPTGDTAAVKSAGKPNSPSVNTFFAQIDRMLRLDNGNEAAPAGEKPSEDPSATIGNNPMSILLAVPTIPANVLETSPDALVSDPAPQAPSGEADVISGTAVAANSANDIGEPKLRSAVAAEMMIATMPDFGKGIAENSPPVRNCPSESSDAAPDAAPGQHVSEPPGQSGLSEDLQIVQDSNLLKEHSFKKPDGIAPAIPGQPNARNVVNPHGSSHREHFTGSQEEPIPPLTAIAEKSPDEFAVKADANTATGREVAAGKLFVSQDSTAQNAEVVDAGSIKTAENSSVGTFENMASGDGRAGGDASRDASMSWGDVQRRLEGGPQNPAKVQTSAVEGKQPAFLAHLFSGNAGGVNPSNPTGLPSETAAARPQEFISQLAERIQFQIRDGNSGIRIQLKPENLGRMEIRAETAGSGVVARIVTESISVKNYLENSVHLLQQALQDQGLKVDRIFIAVNDGASSSSGFNAPFGRDGSGQPGRENQSIPGWSGSPALNALEEVFMDPMTLMAINPDVHFYTIA